MANQFSDDELSQFHRDGYIMLPGLFSDKEVGVLHQHALNDQNIANAGAMNDGDGGASKIWLTAKLGDDLYSAFSHCERILNRMEQIFATEAIYYHHKMMLKEPKVGGAWEWHQDYGYWYNDGFLFPNMASCMIAVDRASQENGCLQVLKGSHKVGRIEHGQVGAQTGANVERVDAIKERLELVYCEMQPGTALFFHSNLLHRSDQNRSEHPRWSLISCYYGADNKPHEPRFDINQTITEKWPDGRILEIAEAAKKRS